MIKAKKLNLRDALKLASILDKYADTKNTGVLDFIEGIVKKIPPTEYLECVILLTNTNVDTIEKELSLNVLSAFIEGLKVNQAISLIIFYRSLAE